MDERAALNFPPAVVSFRGYLEEERDPLSTSECQLCSLLTRSILRHFCFVLFCFVLFFFFNEEF